MNAQAKSHLSEAVRLSWERRKGRGSGGWNEADEARIIELRDQGYSQAEIGREMGRSEKAIESRFRVLRARQESAEARCRRSEVAEAKRAQVKELWALGKKTSEIARAVGLKPASVTDIRYRLNLPARKWRKGADDVPTPPQQDQTTPRALLAAEWQRRGLDECSANLRASLFTQRGAAHELRALRGQT